MEVLRLKDGNPDFPIGVHFRTARDLSNYVLERSAEGVDIPLSVIAQVEVIEMTEDELMDTNFKFQVGDKVTFDDARFNGQIFTIKERYQRAPFYPLYSFEEYSEDVFEFHLTLVEQAVQE